MLKRETQLANTLCKLSHFPYVVLAELLVAWGNLDVSSEVPFCSYTAERPETGGVRESSFVVSPRVAEVRYQRSLSAAL
jgi:hypothetical protein